MTLLVGAASAQSPLLQEGQVVGCFAGRLYRSSAIDVVVYNAKSGDAVLNLLRRLDTLSKKLSTAQSGSPDAFNALLAEHDDVQQQLLGAIRASLESTPHAKTDKNGKFKVIVSEVPESGEVTLVAVDLGNEGDPTYTYKVVRPADKGKVTVWLAGDERACPDYK
jgi:hypothetical protein